MELPALILIFGCLIHNHATALGHGHGHNIPIEGYDSELQDLGQHVEIPETPIKIVKITKTIAVKIPVPYPVKVKEKVPYPVHVSKPYPVPVPHIVHVPQPGPHHDTGDSYHHDDAPNSFSYQDEGPYSSQNTHSYDRDFGGGDPYSITKYEHIESHT